MDLAEWYRAGVFKEGKSVVADQAIAEMIQYLRDKRDGARMERDLEAAWQIFLRNLVTQFPEIMLYNLVQLELPLMIAGMHQECLIVSRFALDLCPASIECTVRLGGSYRYVGDFASAAECFQRAYDMSMKALEGREEAVFFQMNMCDAADILCLLAETQLELRKYADALLSATKAHTIYARSDWDIGNWRSYRALYKVCLNLDLDDLASFYKQKAEAAEEEHRPTFPKK